MTPEELEELATREPWWTNENGKSVPHISITIEERDYLVAALSALEKENERLKERQQVTYNEAAKALEERNTLRAQLTEAKEQLELGTGGLASKYLECEAVLQTELAEAKEENAKLKSALERMRINEHGLTMARDHWMAENAKLREALEYIVTNTNAYVHEWVRNYARNALL